MFPFHPPGAVQVDLTPVLLRPGTALQCWHTLTAPASKDQGGVAAATAATATAGAAASSGGRSSSGGDRNKSSGFASVAPDSNSYGGRARSTDATAATAVVSPEQGRPSGAAGRWSEGVMSYDAAGGGGGGSWRGAARDVAQRGTCRMCLRGASAPLPGSRKLQWVEVRIS